MEDRNPLGRYRLTRRVSGRRGITPIRSKQKRAVPKTRGHKVEKKPYVPLRKHTGSQHDQQRQRPHTDEHSQDSEREGNQDSASSGKREDTEEHAQAEQIRDQENPEQSVHPGTLQAVPDLSQQTASDETAGKTDIEAEELPELV